MDMSLDKLKEEIVQRWPDLPAAHLCVLILDKLETLETSQLSFVTFTTFANMADRKQIDIDVLHAVNILTNTRFSLFDSHAMFIDEANSEHEIPVSDLNKAKATGVFIHPETGEEVPDFEKHVFPFFSASPRLEAEMRKQ